MITEPNIVIIQYITGIGDLLYNKDISDANLSKAIGPILESAGRYNVPVHLLTNSKTELSLPGLHTEHMSLTNYDDLSVYFHRVELTFRFLLEHPEISKVAAVDAGDVEMLNYPFEHVKKNKLYIGSENIKLRDSWIVKDNQNPDFINDFLLENGHLLTVSPGTVVGTREMVLEYFGMMTKIISESKLNQSNQVPGYDLGKYEMALGNYVAHKYFSDRLVYGREVTTKVTAYEPQSSAWFRHK